MTKAGYVIALAVVSATAGLAYSSQPEAMQNLRSFIRSDPSFATYMRQTYQIDVAHCHFVNGDTWWQGSVAEWESSEQDITLTGNGNFIIVAAGCNESSDLDMRVYDAGTRERLDEDTATDNYPICAVAVGGRRTITVEIIANDTTSGTAHFAFAILYE